MTAPAAIQPEMRWEGEPEGPCGDERDKQSNRRAGDQRKNAKLQQAVSMAMQISEKCHRDLSLWVSAVSGLPVSDRWKAT